MKFTPACCNLFCNVFLLHASKLCKGEAEKRLLSGSTCRKFPGPSSQFIAAKSLLDQHFYLMYSSMI